MSHRVGTLAFGTYLLPTAAPPLLAASSSLSSSSSHHSPAARPRDYRDRHHRHDHHPGPRPQPWPHQTLQGATTARCSLLRGTAEEQQQQLAQRRKQKRLPLHKHKQQQQQQQEPQAVQQKQRERHPPQPQPQPQPASSDIAWDPLRVTPAPEDDDTMVEPENSVAGGPGGQNDDDDDDDDTATTTPLDAAPQDRDGLVTLELLGRRLSFPGRYLLYGVPFLWGTFGPAVRVLFAVEPHPVPSLFNTERLLLANTVYLPILIGELAAVRKRVRGKDSAHDVTTPGDADPDADAASSASASSPAPPSPENYDDPYLSIKAGLELGAWVFLANVAQVLGLEATSASRAAFLVQLQTVFIPVLAGLFGLNRVGRNTWISSLVAISGVALLSLDKGHGTQSSILGDSLEVLSAVFFSAYVIRLGGYCNRIAPGPLIAIKIMVQAGLSFLWALGMEAWTLTAHPVMHSPDGPASWNAHAIFVNVAVIAWTGIMTSAASGWLQTKGQQFVPASESAVIFATQPLWASATAAVLLGESFGPRGIGGGALIVLATAFASMSEAKKKEVATVGSGSGDVEAMAKEKSM